MSFARPAASDVSYLQARDSGYGYGRARASSAALPGLAPPQRDLTDELVQQGAVVASSAALRVFLRVRPQLEGDFGDSPQEERKAVLEMPDNVHLLMHAPKDSATYKNGMNGNGKLTHRYTFSHIFRPETDQQQLFRQTTLNHITEFVNGHSCLLFTYGATNSGKTYTVQGSPSEPGLLPRALDMLFNSVCGQLYGRLDIQPRAFSDVCRVSPRDEEAALRLKREALRLGSESEPPAELAASRAASEESLTTSSLYRSQDSLATSMESLTEIRLCSEIEGRRRESAAVNMNNQPNTRFSVWVSYLEIYNEYVYDLLEKIPTGKRRRTALHLGLDKKGNTYVKGLRQVQVRSADEACQVLRAGRQNLHFASNRLNHNSSRSHCVFSVKLIRMLDTDNPSVARISQFSVCDLAGSERVEKTLAAGARMKEAGNINTSLMVLGRCMKAMRQAQKAGGAAAGASTGGGALVPYRDSKLTRIFQSYFCGGSGLGARVTMIVNVSPSPIVFDETIQVLKFSALAKQVSIQEAEKRRAPSRFSTMVRRSMQVAAAAVGAAVGRPRPLLNNTAALDDTQTDEQYQNLVELVETLRHELVEAKRENAGLEARIRQELCVEFEQHMVQIEKDWQERMQEAERYMESRAELQMTAVAAGIKAEYSRKRRRTADDSDDDAADDGDDEQQEAEEVKELRERVAAAEQRCALLEQQLEAEAADRQQATQRATQRQEELTRLAVQLTESRETADRLQRELEEAEQRCRRHLESRADDPLVAQLTQQVAKLQEELRFRDMDLRETREYLQEGGDEFLQLEAASERLQREVAQLQQQLAQRDEALRDQQALQGDLEELLAGRSQRIAELEEQLQRRAERCACGARGLARPAQPAIPEEDGEEAVDPAEMSFGSRLRALRSRTGAVLRQVASPQVTAAGRTDGDQELRSRVETLQAQVSDLTQSQAALQRHNSQLEQKLEEGEKLRAANQKLNAQLAMQERVVVNLVAATPGRTPAEKRSAPPDLHDTTGGFEEMERLMIEEERLQNSQEREDSGAAEQDPQTEKQESSAATEEELSQATVLHNSQAKEQDMSQAKEQDISQAKEHDISQAKEQDISQANEQEISQAQEHKITQTAEQGSQTTEQDADSQSEQQRQQREQLEQELAEARAEAARLTSELSEQRSVAERLTAECDELRAQHVTMTSEVARADERVAEIQRRAAELEEQLQQLEEQQQQLRQGLQQKVEEQQQQLEEFQQKMEELQQRWEEQRQQLQAVTEERERLRGEAAEAGGAAARLTEAHRELEHLQREYKQTLHLKSEAEADAAVCEREMKGLRAELERARQGDGPLLERLRTRDTEVEVLQARLTALSREEEAFSILKAELEAKKEELRQCNVVELRAHLERAEAENGHVKDELERRSNELLKLNIQIDNLKRQLVEREEDVQKTREERSRSMQMSEQNIRRKNEELNRERHESSHLRDMMARLTPRSSSTLQAELDSTRAECRRKEDRIQQLEARLRASQAELVACTPTPTPRRAASRPPSVQIVDPDGEEEAEVTPMVLKSRSRSCRSGRRTGGRAPPAEHAEPTETEHSEEEQEPEEPPASRRRTRRRAANRSAVRFTDENAEPEMSEGSSSVSCSSRTRAPLNTITEKQPSTPVDQLLPPRAAKSTGTKRKLFKRCSDQIMECSPVEMAEKHVSPRKVVTRSLRSRKK